MWEEVGYICTSRNRDSQLASRSVLHNFTDDVLTIAVNLLFQSGTAWMLEAYWRRRVKHLCWWNLYTWPRSPVQVGWMKMKYMGNSKRLWVILNMDLRSPWVCRGISENSRRCWRAVSYGTYQSHFTNFKAIFCAFSNASVPRDMMGWQLHQLHMKEITDTLYSCTAVLPTNHFFNDN